MSALAMMALVVCRAPAGAAADAPLAIRTFDGRLAPRVARRDQNFGRSQALTGSHAIVGAPGAGQRSGAAFVFPRSAGGFGAATKLAPDDLGEGAAFGWAVATSSDIAVVGAPWSDAAAGAAYVFRRVGDGWQQEARLVAPDREADARFGWALALSGDTLVVGAPAADGDAGAAYVFERVGAEWVQEAKLVGGAGWALGWSVALGQDTLFAGAPRADGEAGRGLIAVRENGSWSSAAEIMGDAQGESDQAFGVGAAMDGDTLIVGAESDDAGAPDSGAAYVFVRTNGGWQRQAKLASASPSDDARFGLRVALSGDVAVVGAPLGRSPIDDTESGTAYVFVRSRGAWTEALELAGDSGFDDEFGHVAVDGTTALVGAPLHDEPRKDAGAVYVYDLTGLGLGTERASGVQVSPDGRRVLISKDVDGALGAERWAIVRDLSDETVTGNVFPADGGAPAFVFCATVGRTGDEVALECSTAQPCLSSPCLATDWASAGTVRVPAEFLEPPAP